MEERNDSVRGGSGVVWFARVWEDYSFGLLEGFGVITKFEEGVEKVYQNVGVGLVYLFPESKLYMVGPWGRGIGESFECQRNVLRFEVFIVCMWVG